MASKLIWVLSFLLPICLAVSTAQADEIRIGLMTDLSGVHSNNGEECKRGFEIARKAFALDDKIARKKVSFVYADSQSTPKLGTNAFQKLVSVDKVHAVAMISSRIGMAVNPISKRMKVPLIGLVANSDFTKENPYSFSSWWDAAVEGEALASLVSELEKKRLAVLTAEDDYTLSVRDSFVAKVKAQGSVVTFNETVTPEELDFRAIVTRIKAVGPDGVMVNLVTGQTGVFMRELRQAGINAQLLGSFFISKPDELAVAGKEASDGALFVLPNYDRPTYRQYTTELFPGASPAALSYSCYAGLALLIRALESCPTCASRADIYDALVGMRSIEVLDEVLPVKERRIVFQKKIKIISDGVAKDYGK